MTKRTTTPLARFVGSGPWGPREGKRASKVTKKMSSHARGRRCGRARKEGKGMKKIGTWTRPTDDGRRTTDHTHDGLYGFGFPSWTPFASSSGPSVSTLRASASSRARRPVHGPKRPPSRARSTAAWAGSMCPMTNGIVSSERASQPSDKLGAGGRQPDDDHGWYLPSPGKKHADGSFVDSCDDEDMQERQRAGHRV